MSCPRTHHLNNVPILKGEKHDISMKILHQAGFETARQAATSAERHALTIAPCPPLRELFREFGTKRGWRAPPAPPPPPSGSAPGQYRPKYFISFSVKTFFVTSESSTITPMSLTLSARRPFLYVST